jgi:hypothetical protein
MSYIGKSPAVGNFVKLDAITTSSTNTYNLTVDSVAFVPESANHMLVSLNGVIQAPLSSFSVSGSTITFLPASGTLTSSDSIDFIMVYGNVLDIGVPSDSTVTNAKTNFVSTSSNAGLQIKGDNTTAGTLQLNCEQNSHGIKLRSPSHSASASYTLTFPTTDGNADEFLKTDGSGALSWASAGGVNTPSFHAYLSSAQSIPNITQTLIQFDTEAFDSAGAYDTSTYKFTPQVAGKYVVYAQMTPNSGDDYDTFELQMYKNEVSTAGTQALCRGRNEASDTKYINRIVEFNGSTDFVYMYTYQDSSASRNIRGTKYDTFFGAYKIIE